MIQIVVYNTSKIGKDGLSYHKFYLSFICRLSSDVAVDIIAIITSLLFQIRIRIIRLFEKSYGELSPDTHIEYVVFINRILWSSQREYK